MITPSSIDYTFFTRDTRELGLFERVVVIKVDGVKKKQIITITMIKPEAVSVLTKPFDLRGR